MSGKAKQPSRRVRRAVFNRDGWRCRYCGGIDSRCPPGHTQYHLDGGWTVDHVLPRSRGGTHEKHNLVTCCHPCNNRKADRTPEEARMPLLPLAPHPFVVTSLRDALFNAGMPLAPKRQHNRKAALKRYEANDHGN